MELNPSKEKITINETVCDCVSEIPVQSDFMLPDYYPDIQKILKCTLNPQISSRYHNGDKIVIDGICTIKAIYVSPEGDIKCLQNKLPINKVMTVRENCGNIVINTSIKTEYCNCRAINQRRMDIKGSISLKLLAVNQNDMELISDASGCNIQLKKDITQCSVVICDICEVFNVKDGMEIPHSKPPIGKIVYYDILCNVTDYRVITNKVITKGELIVHLLYESDENNKYTEKMDFNVPFNQIIDAPKVDESSECLINFNVVNCDLTSNIDNENESREIILDSNVVANIKVYHNRDVCIVGDAYSTKYEVTNKSEKTVLQKLAGITKENITTRNTIEMDSEVKEIIDVWCKPFINFSECIDGIVKLKGISEVSILAINDENDYVWHDKNIDIEYEHDIKTKGNIMLSEQSISPLSTTFTLGNSDKIEIRAEFVVSFIASKVYEKEVVTDMDIDMENEKQIFDDNALTIYYADERESVWNIAKKYNTSVTSVIEENNLEEDIMKKRGMLLIPIIE